MRIAGVAHRKLNGLRLNEIRRRAHSGIFLYWVGRVGRFVESGRGKFLQPADADRCDACPRRAVVRGQGAVAIFALRRCQTCTCARTAKRGAKRCNHYREKSKDRDGSTAQIGVSQHIHRQFSTVRREIRTVNSSAPSGFAASFTSAMGLILRDHDFAGERAVDVGEISGGKQDANGPPHRANLEPVVCRFGVRDRQ